MVQWVSLAQGRDAARPSSTRRRRIPPEICKCMRPSGTDLDDLGNSAEHSGLEVALDSLCFSENATGYLLSACLVHVTLLFGELFLRSLRGWLVE